MDSELLLKFIGYFRDYRFGIVAYAFTLFLVNLCRNSCIYNFFFLGGGGGGGRFGGVCVGGDFHAWVLYVACHCSEEDIPH